MRTKKLQEAYMQILVVNYDNPDQLREDLSTLSDRWRTTVTRAGTYAGVRVAEVSCYYEAVGANRDDFAKRIQPKLRAGDVYLGSNVFDITVKQLVNA